MTELTRPAPLPTRRSDASRGPVATASWRWDVTARGAGDPWDRLDEASRHAEWFAWHDGRRGTTYVAWGAVDRLTPTGPSRFAAVRDWSAALLGRLHPEADGLVWGLPLAVGGLSLIHI